MAWFRRKPQPQPQKPEPTPQPNLPVQIDVLRVEDLDLEQIATGTHNTMAAREILNSLFMVIKLHIADGHDCPPWCSSEMINQIVFGLNETQARMVLYVLAKDVMNNWRVVHD
jgi:hypothetical protein